MDHAERRVIVLHVKHRKDAYRGRRTGQDPKKELRRVVKRIRSLEDQSRPQGCKKLSAQERYRIRQGDYRVVYSIDDAGRTVEIVKVGHPGEVYRK